MSGFPVQLGWSQFVGALRKLGYKPVKPHRGSGRVFFNPTRTPNLILFHEPNPGDTLPRGTLHDSLRKLQLSPDEFVRLRDVERRPYRLVQGRFVPTKHHVEPSPKKNVRINAEYPSMQFIGGRTTIAH
jgi:predicted RNA binding protein YcfA (HicA-like mRNA interferase family)